MHITIWKFSGSHEMKTVAVIKQNHKMPISIMKFNIKISILKFCNI